jgi:Myb-like DNA-binding domain
MSERNDNDRPNERAIASNSLNPNQFRYSHQSSRIDYQTYRYSRLLNSESQNTTSAIDPLSITANRKKRLHESIVLNTKWTEEEKEKFFTALARCGKGNLQEISRRIGTKSLVEVTAYVDLLNKETIWRKQSKRRKVFDLRTVPAAVEVDEKWLVFEEKMAAKLAKKSDVMVEMEMDQDMVLNIEKANELAEWYFQSL